MFTVLAASATTFAATNLDDLFLLTMFFARRVATRRIVAGQYFGFAAIVIVSLAGVWAAGAAVPQGWIRRSASSLWPSGSKRLLSYIIPNRHAPRNATAR